MGTTLTSIDKRVDALEADMVEVKMDVSELKTDMNSTRMTLENVTNHSI
ncbi:MAG: hypothetical protein GX663_00220 [Clostridiales bacterium]|nr:hypothetical protein [Clostridiales bacterium]